MNSKTVLVLAAKRGKRLLVAMAVQEYWCYANTANGIDLDEKSLCFDFAHVPADLNTT